MHSEEMEQIKTNGVQEATSCLIKLENHGAREQTVTSFLEQLKLNGEQESNLKNLHSKEVFDSILNMAPEHLIGAIAHRKDKRREGNLACRDLNILSRANYAIFIEKVGTNIYPLIIATDHEENYAGVGSTFTLFLEDGREFKMTPSMWSNYEIYKSISHSMLGLSVIIGPFLMNPSSTAWHQPLSNYLTQLQSTKLAIESSTDETLDKQTVLPILESVIQFCQQSLNIKTFLFDEWRVLNEQNFCGLKHSMELATEIQAECCIEELLKWKAMLGAQLWREMYVVIPTVWPVATNNPRLEIFRNLLDRDRISTHIIMSEYPRSTKEIRTLLGRVVGDRAIGRFVFGDQTHEQKMKVVGLSTGVDAVTDDSIPNIMKAFKKRGITTIPFLQFQKKETTSTDCPLSAVKNLGKKCSPFCA